MQVGRDAGKDKSRDAEGETSLCWGQREMFGRREKREKYSGRGRDNERDCKAGERLGREGRDFAGREERHGQEEGTLLDMG